MQAAVEVQQQKIKTCKSTFPQTTLELAWNQQYHEVRRSSHVCRSWGQLGTADDKQKEKANPKATERRGERFWDEKRTLREDLRR